MDEKRIRLVIFIVTSFRFFSRNVKRFWSKTKNWCIERKKSTGILGYSNWWLYQTIERREIEDLTKSLYIEIKWKLSWVIQTVKGKPGTEYSTENLYTEIEKYKLGYLSWWILSGHRRWPGTEYLNKNPSTSSFQKKKTF